MPLETVILGGAAKAASRRTMLKSGREPGT
jgi:hypothetical protein